MGESDFVHPDSSDPIRVLIADDHAMTRAGLRYFILAFEDLRLAGEADSGEEAVRLCAELQPDVVLMDLMMPGMAGVTAIQVICGRWPHIRVIALTSFQDSQLVRDALRAGAIGYLLKNASADDLVNAIRTVRQGKPALAPEAARVLIQVATHTTSTDFGLTSREREVLALMVKGLNNPDMAERLMVSRSTVKFHVSNILSKLGVTTRAEAVALAWQHNLVT